jgi:hypothetical protein
MGHEEVTKAAGLISSYLPNSLGISADILSPYLYLWLSFFKKSLILLSILGILGSNEHN